MRLNMKEASEHVLGARSWRTFLAHVFGECLLRVMRPTSDGDLLIRQSGTNRVMRVDIGS